MTPPESRGRTVSPPPLLSNIHTRARTRAHTHTHTALKPQTAAKTQALPCQHAINARDESTAAPRAIFTRYRIILEHLLQVANTLRQNR
jgi:hypothetical protein